MNILFRMGIGFLIGCIASLIFGHWFIPMLRRLKAGQSIREEGPQSHLSKAGTPTIGGIMFLAALPVGLLLTKNFNYQTAILCISLYGYALVGFIDDYIKVINKRNLGFRAWQKLLAQIAISILVIFMISSSESLSTGILLPGTDRLLHLGILLIPFVVFVVVGTVNSVNLTDGLDGLSSSVTIVVMLFFALVSYKMDRNEVALFCVILAGALIGFYHYNKYPAQVFMGDTGSLALGGAVVAVAFLLNLPLILPLAGGIYFIETLSVILQVASFKLRGKRIFLMSPIHHHFEQKGHTEKQIVRMFVIVEIILCAISYWILF